jgi:dienelactone hydrolase
MDALWKVGECLLRWGTLAYCSVFPAVSRSYNSKTYPCPVEQKYHDNGPYQVTVHSIDGIYVFVPDSAHNVPLPTVVMVNGTGLMARHYRPVFEHLASWGFVVIGNDDSNAWNGRSALVSLDKALFQNSMVSSPLYQRIDLDRIGVVGHSQGAMGAINAATEDDRFKVLYAASCPQKSLAKKLGWSYSMKTISIPTMLVAGTGWIDRHISPLESLLHLADELPDTTPMLLGRLKGVEHRFVLHEGDAYMTAWLCHYLKDGADAAFAFSGDTTEAINNPRWQDVKMNWLDND